MQTAIVQMCSSPDVAANLASAHALLTQAAAQGAELAVLPEYFCGMGRHEHDKLAWAEDFGSGPIQEALARWAQELGLWIVAGTLPLRSPAPQRVFNTSLVFNPQGQCCARYDKIHLFRFGNEREQYDEAAAITPGTRPVVAEVTDRSGHRWRVGLSVCYDLRFPELYRHHAQAGADIMVVPSAFTRTTGQAHWEVLLPPVMITPSVAFTPKVSASSADSSLGSTPIQPRVTCPSFTMPSSTRRAVDTGMAKPIPMLPPERE